MTPEQTRLVERLRALLVDQPTLREVSMFGGRSLMVNEKMIVSASKDAGLLVRVDAELHSDLLQRPGASQAVMGQDRDMGPGWIQVDADAIADDEQLSYWVRVAMEYNRKVPGVDR